MAQGGTERRRVRGGNGEAAPADLLRLVRSSHIFASAVREILELKLLRDVCTYPLTLSQFHLLKLMSTNGHHQVGQVADFLGVSPPAATKNIDKLEKHGLVHRSRSEGDRRATLLSVSPRGRRLVLEYERQKAALVAQLLGSFTPEEATLLTHLLERFAVSLFQHQPRPDGVCLRCAAYLEAHCPVGALRGGCPYQEGREAHA